MKNRSLRILFFVLVVVFSIAACSSSAKKESKTQSISNESVLKSEGLSQKKDRSVNQENLASIQAAAPFLQEAPPQATAALPAQNLESAQAQALPTPFPTQTGPLPPTGPSKGLLAPNFSLKSLDGSQVSISDLRGKVLLLNYWATWCVPCKEEMPVLEKIKSEYQSKGVFVLTINAIDEDNLDQVQQFVKQLGVTLPVLLDQGKLVKDSYQVKFFPTSFFVDPSGVIRDIVLGSTTEEKIREKIDSVITGNYN